jgi:lysozyme family protein
MPTVKLTAALRSEYESLFTTCVVRDANANAVEGLVQKLVGNRPRYEAAAAASGVPWHFIAVVHNMESSQSFKGHLHNGDPLTARTVQVPRGYPKSGNPPFTWEESAADALALKSLGKNTDWSLAGTLYELERYNGFGYRLYHPHVLSPYLWGFSNHYTSGKYVADGTWSDTAKTAQCGAAVLLRRMSEKNLFGFADQPLPAPDASPLVVAYSMSKSKNQLIVDRVLALQAWLTGHPGVFLKLDGIPGSETSKAYHMVTGSYLPGDPRA